MFQTAIKTGEHVAIEAGAGTGKTSTLLLLARWATGEKLSGRYFAFNKSIVTETAAKVEAEKLALTAKTIHSAAYGPVGSKFRARLSTTSRMRSSQVATVLGIRPMTVGVEGTPKVLSAEYLASLTLGALGIYCQSADEAPGESHFAYIEGIDTPTEEGKRTYHNNDAVRSYLAPFLRKAWADAQDPNGKLPYSHAYYLKQWERSSPRIKADYIMIDEAQDIAPVMASIIYQQVGTPVVFVGDSAQSIYEWAGAIDAIGAVIRNGAATSRLSKSFRFGPEIAAVANVPLTHLGADMRITGAGKPGTVGPITGTPNAVLSRTNAAAVRAYLGAFEAGVKAHIIGGGKELIAFAQAAIELQRTGRTNHPDLRCFTSWPEVRDYVRSDSQGEDLRLLVSLVDDFGPATLVAALERMPRESDADLVISTAHKAKGREWDSVRLAEDFVPKAIDGAQRPMTDAELRLLYVAITRARVALDVTAVASLLADGAA